MPMPTATQRWTADEVRALPRRGRHHEVVDGALLVNPPPSWDHQAAVLELAMRLRAYLRECVAGAVLVAPAAVAFDSFTLVEPDVLVVPLVDGRRPRNWEAVGRLLLVAEVVSPGSARADRVVKRRLYQRQGVDEYWVVDIHARLVERWRPADERPEVLTERLEWRPQMEHPSLVLDLPAYFAEVLGTPHRK